MNIGIAITPFALMAAASEQEHFALLDSIPLTEDATPETIAAILLSLLPSVDEAFGISIPPDWTMTERLAFSQALYAQGVSLFALIPEPLAALSALQQQLDTTNQDIIYLQKQNPQQWSYSFLSCFASDPSVLWEGSATGDDKFFRKTAHWLGFLHKSVWSEHLLVCGTEDSLPSSLKNIPCQPLHSEDILRALTLFYEHTLKLAKHLRYRCHSHFSLINQDGSVSMLIPFAGALLPLPWADYCCLSFWDDNTPLLFAEPETEWTLYEKNLWSSQPQPETACFSFRLTEPSGLWLSNIDGHMEVLPFTEDTPRCTLPLLLPDRKKAAEELQQLLQQLQQG